MAWPALWTRLTKSLNLQILKHYLVYIRYGFVVFFDRSVCAVLVSSLRYIGTLSSSKQNLRSYWDATANNWAFDYDAYYAAYGQSSTANYDNATYQAQAYEQASAYGQAPMSGFNQFGPASGANGLGGPTDKKKKLPPGPKDADGNAIAGTLKKGQTRETVLRKSVGKLYEDQTLLEWDPCKSFAREAI